VVTTIDCDTVSQAFQRFHQETGGDVASAAMLTLGAILAGQNGAEKPTEEPGLEPELFTVPEAAKWLSISERALRDLVASDSIRYIRLGNGRGSIRFTRQNLQDYVDLSASPPPRPTCEKQRKYLKI